MKNVFKAVSVALFLLAAASAAQANQSPEFREPQGKFWDQVHALVLQCAVQTFTYNKGQKVYGSLQSVCDEVQVKGSEAHFRLRGDWYTATLQESPDADDGDLDDIFVSDRIGESYAERHEIPAFGDVLLGLAGGKVQLPERYVEELAQ